MHSSIVKTYACKNAIPNSRIKKAQIKTNGRKPARPKPRVAVPKMKSRICPASMFANNRMLRLSGRIKNDKISITISRGKSHIGMLDGRNIFKNLRPRFLNPSIIQAEKKLSDNSNVSAI
jgi:hypothetical protein